MDKRTIKSIILELKNEGKSFQAISDILARDYKVSMSRQAVCGMYTRITSDENVVNNQNIMLATTDIMKYHTIGVDVAKIKSILNSIGVNISLSRINEIIDDNTDYKTIIYNDLINIVSNKIKSGEDIENIKRSISYKGEQPSDSVLNKLFIDYATSEIRNSIVNITADVYNITENKSLVKKISQQFNTNLTLRDLSKALNL